MSTTMSTDAPERELLRKAHRVRALAPAEEGTGLLRLPAHVYGFTHSPATDNAPLFAMPTRHSFEVHRLADSAMLLAYVSREAAAVLEHVPETCSITMYPVPNDEAPVLVAIDWSRLHLVKRSVTPDVHGGIHLQVAGRGNPA
jgi:hypothetical protein